MSQLVKVDRDELRDLVQAATRLEALEGAGVDNWDGYEMAERATEEQIDQYVDGYIKA